MAPTISTTAALILGDVLAIALMERRRVTLDDYAANHPAGTIGKRITVRVKDLMLQDDLIPLAGAESRVVDILVELSQKRAGCILIVDHNKILEGIFTDGDLRRALLKHGELSLKMPLKELMTKTSRTISPTTLAFDALKVMEGDQKSPIMVLPVIDENKKVLGLIKMHDILQSGI